MFGLLGDVFGSLNMQDLAGVLCRDLPILVGAKNCTFYLKHCTHNKLMQFTSNGSSEVDHSVSGGVPAMVLATGQTVKHLNILSKTTKVSNCTNGAKNDYTTIVEKEDEDEGATVDHVAQQRHLLAVPIICKNGERFGVLQLEEKIESAGGAEGFTPADEAALKQVLPFCTLAIRNAQTFEQALLEARWSNVLLGLARNLFETLDSKDAVVTKIMINAVKLLKCEKCSVFMVDHETNELYAKVFDVSHETVVDPAKSSEMSEIRFPMHVGIAGHVASTGEVLNIPNAYNDERFNQNVDVKTGFKTRTILCMPIHSVGGKVVGVAQLINKLGGTFTSKDELLFDAFAIFCGLSIAAVTMFEEATRAASRHKVVLEVLSYQVSANDDETERLRLSSVPTARTLGLGRWDLDVKVMEEEKLMLSVVRMFADLGFIHQFRIPYRVLCRWIITVRKNYRMVTYHNWQHAFGVTQTMFAMITNAQLSKYLTPLELMAMIVACICHDLDHRGTNNSFEGLKKSDLSKLYGTSTMERHHFDMFVMILNCDENNFMVNLNVKDYKSFVKCIEKLILATDISMYLKNRASYQSLVESGAYDWNIEEHRIKFMSMCMTASDLSAIIKPWPIQQATAEIVYSEFYEQGDMEKEFGHTPGELFDASKSENLPKMQIGFINFICLPVYESLALHLDEAKPMLSAVLENRKHWAALAEHGNYKLSERRVIQTQNNGNSALIRNLQTSLPDGVRVSKQQRLKGNDGVQTGVHSSLTNGNNDGAGSKPSSARSKGGIFSNKGRGRSVIQVGEAPVSASTLSSQKDETVAAVCSRSSVLATGKKSALCTIL